MTPDVFAAAALAQLLVVGWAGPDGPTRAVSLHHARVSVYVEPAGSLAAHLEVDGGAGEVEALVDAWAGWSPWAPVQVRLGWMQAPLGLASDRSLWDVHLPDRPGAAMLAGDLRGPGAQARVNLLGEWLEARAGLVRTRTRGLIVSSGRLVASWGPVELGMGGTNAYDAAADLRLGWTGGELSAGHQRGTTRRGQLVRGSWVEVAQHIVGPRWSVLARAETLDDDARTSDAGDLRNWTAGLSATVFDGLEAQVLWVRREELDRSGVGVTASDDDQLLFTLALEAFGD